MTPLVVDKNDAKSLNASCESSAWKEYVRPELADGLLVKMRFYMDKPESMNAK